MVLLFKVTWNKNMDTDSDDQEELEAKMKEYFVRLLGGKEDNSKVNT